MKIAEACKEAKMRHFPILDFFLGGGGGGGGGEGVEIIHHDCNPCKE